MRCNLPADRQQLSIVGVEFFERLTKLFYFQVCQFTAKVSQEIMVGDALKPLRGAHIVIIQHLLYMVKNIYGIIYTAGIVYLVAELRTCEVRDRGIKTCGKIESNIL